MAITTCLLVVEGLLRERGAVDYRLLRAFQRPDFPGLRWLFETVSLLTSSTYRIASWLAALAAFALARRWLPALAMATLPIGGGINMLIGAIVQRPRPDPDQLLRASGRIEATSFPSGHVIGAVMLYGALWYFARRIRSPLLRLLAQGFALAVIGLVGLSRIWLGAHWVSDVVAAYTLGGTLLLALFALYERLDVAVGQLRFRHQSEPPGSLPATRATTGSSGRRRRRGDCR